MITHGLNARGAIVSFGLNPAFETEPPFEPAPFDRTAYVTDERRVAAVSREPRLAMVVSEERMGKP